MSRKDRWLAGGVGAVLFVASFTYVVWRASPPVESPRQAPEPSEFTTLAGEAEVVIRYLAGDGSVAETRVERVSSELVGLRLDEIEALRPNWSIRSFSPHRLVVDTPCSPAAEGGGFLSVHEGRVAIFSGSPEGCRELRDVTRIAAESLPEPVRSALEEGISFGSDAELPQLLEGIQGGV